METFEPETLADPGYPNLTSPAGPGGFPLPHSLAPGRARLVGAKGGRLD